MYLKPYFKIIQVLEDRIKTLIYTHDQIKIARNMSNMIYFLTRTRQKTFIEQIFYKNQYKKIRQIESYLKIIDSLITISQLAKDNQIKSDILYSLYQISSQLQEYKDTEYFQSFYQNYILNDNVKTEIQLAIQADYSLSLPGFNQSTQIQAIKLITEFIKFEEQNIYETYKDIYKKVFEIFSQQQLVSHKLESIKLLNTLSCFSNESLEIRNFFLSKIPILISFICQYPKITGWGLLTLNNIYKYHNDIILNIQTVDLILDMIENFLKKQPDSDTLNKLLELISNLLQSQFDIIYEKIQQKQILRYLENLQDHENSSVYEQSGQILLNIERRLDIQQE